MRIRPTARLVVLNHDRRVLLFKVQDERPLHKNQPGLVNYWCTPGGGVDSGETYEQAAVRELLEETGIVCPELGPWLWTGRKILLFPDEDVEFQERFFLVDAGRCSVETGGHTDYERLVLAEHRWWSLAEMRKTSETFIPRGLPDLIAPIIAGDIPAKPFLLPEY